MLVNMRFFFFFQAEDGIRDATVTGVQTCALPILDPGDRVRDAALGESVIDVGSQRERDAPPGKVGAGKLFKKIRRGLEDHGVREGHDASGRASVAAGDVQLHQVQANKSDVDDVAGNIADLDPVSDADAVAADEEEISDDAEDHVLQGDGDASRKEAGKGGQRADLGGERDEDDEDHHQRDHNAAQQHELVAATLLANVAEDGTAPELGGSGDQQNGHEQGGDSHQQGTPLDHVGAFGFGVPGFQIVRGRVEQDVDLG